MAWHASLAILTTSWQFTVCDSSTCNDIGVCLTLPAAEIQIAVRCPTAEVLWMASFLPCLAPLAEGGRRCVAKQRALSFLINAQRLQTGGAQEGIVSFKARMYCLLFAGNLPVLPVLWSLRPKESCCMHGAVTGGDLKPAQ
jgi:hypothetical protein